jgi:tetratricopeptide (TPR) repeat protein
MLLRHFTNRCRCGLPALVLCSLVLAGCATGPGSQDEAVGANGQPLQNRDIPQRARTLYEQAVAAMAAGDTVDAELRFKEFLLQYPDFPGAYVNLAIISAGRGDDQAAESSVASALAVDPDHPAALNQRGMLLRRQGKFSEAEAAYLKAVTADPDYALAHYNLGVLNELYLKRLDAALQHYERYQEISGEDKQVTKWLADLERRIDVAQRTASVTE